MSMSSIYRVDRSDVETFTVVTNPWRTYASSSTHGSAGSVYVFARRSDSMKDAAPDSSFVDSRYDACNYVSALRSAQQSGKIVRVMSADAATTGSFANMMSQYMDSVNAASVQRRLQQSLDVTRFVPPPVFNSNTLRKLFIKDVLQPYYRTSYPTAHWAYTNYSCLNFFTASGFPTSSAIIYPNIAGDGGGMTFHEGYCSGTYTPSGSFSFDFYVNPRYSTDNVDGSFKAGTIMHLSSTFALSLVSGSCKDQNGRPAAFRLLLQLSCSADVPPSWLAPTSANRATAGGQSGSYVHVSSSLMPPVDLAFFSDDNVLMRNHWHHVVVRWGTVAVDGGKGTFNVDGVDRGTFTVPSATITPSIADVSAMGVHNPPIPGIQQLEPSVLCIGNFFEGPNHSASPQAAFFALDPATREGLNVLLADPGTDVPTSYGFNHPLNAELHDLAIRRRYLTDVDIRSSSSVGPVCIDNTFAFYVPPFFVEQSPYRASVNGRGGILVSPFQEVDASTTAPFNVSLSFGVGGHYINLENFVKDFASNTFPLLHHLTGVAITTTTLDVSTCNQYLYSQPFVAKRNLTILPCDDGSFVPSYGLLASESMARAVDDLGIEETSFISLDDMVMTSTLVFGAGTFDDGSRSDANVNTFADMQLGTTPEQPFSPAGPATVNYYRNVVSGSDVEQGAPLTVYQRTQDPSSNQVTVFDISNLFYGFRIMPRSVRVCDVDIVRSSFAGAGMPFEGVFGPVTVTLADDGRGNLYRADCLTSQSTWNSMGNVYYDEGLMVVKSPHLYFFGHDSYTLDFRGEQHVHVLKVEALAPNNQLNSSSNPAYASLSPTGQPNDTEDGFVYVTGVNFHDSDFNVVMKTQLAQPIVKRFGDRILFKVKMDF